MSEYSHSLRKFADQGLQLRVPVDLIPPTQYGRLTNAIPVIEGELRAREGVTLIQDVFLTACVATLERPNLASLNASICTTIYPNGYIAGEDVTITVTDNDPDSVNVVTPGTYTVTITSIVSPTEFTFSPTIPVTWNVVSAVANVFAQAVGAGPTQTLAQTAITNIVRLNEQLPSVPDDIIIAMSGRLYRANLGSPVPVTLTASITGISGSGGFINFTVASNPFSLGQTIQVTGSTAYPVLNGVFFIITAFLAGPIVRCVSSFGILPFQADNGTLTTHVTPPPAFAELVLPPSRGNSPTTQNGFSGGPMSLVEFRFTNDPISWMIAADGSQMVKFREQGGALPYLFFGLGNYVPQQPASASISGAGNLNGDYDWRYTYHDDYTNTEGNPSPGTVNGTPNVQHSTAQTNPDPRFNSGGAFAYTNNAFTGVTNVSGTGTASQTALNTFYQTSCRWTTFTNPVSTPFLITLSVTWQVTITKVNAAPCQAQLQYSVDNGATFHNFAVVSNASSGTLTSTVTLPLSTNFGQIQVAAWGFLNVDLANKTTGNSITILITNIEVDSNLAPTSGTLTLANQQALVCCQAPITNDGRITSIRLYRRGGSLPDDWRLVGTFPLDNLATGSCGAGFLEIADNVPDDQLSTQPILELDNDMPVTSITNTNQPLSFIWGPVGVEARLLGCGDPNRPECVYFSKPGNPDAWPPENFVEVSSPGTPIIAGCVYNNQSYAFSREGIYLLQEGYISGITFTPFKTPSAHGLFSPWGLAQGPAMYFVAKDGIYESTGGQEVSLVENDIKPLFPTYDTPGQDVEGYEAVDMTLPDNIRLRYHNDELYFLYTGTSTGTRQMLIYDILKKRWRSGRYSCGMSEAYSQPDTVSSLLLGSDAGSYFEAGGSLDPFQLDVIENISITSVTTTFVSITPGTYYARVSRFLPIGEVALSNEVSGLIVNGVRAIQVVFPGAPEGTTKWRVYFGTTVGQEDQYVEKTEAQVAALLNRTLVIKSGNVLGTVPTVNADHNIAVNIRTGSNDQGAPLNRKQYGNVIFDIDPGGATIANPVTITPYINGEVQSEAAITVTGSGRQQIPLDLTDYFAFNTEYQITWERVDTGTVVTDPVLFQHDTLYFLEPVGVKHWENQPTSFGFPGFIHCRDAYIALRSTSIVVLTMNFDGITQTFNIPSTGGERRKVYVQFNSNKGLMYQFSMDAVDEFRVYEPDLEVRVKPWLGVLGYAVQRVLGGEVAA